MIVRVLSKGFYLKKRLRISEDVESVTAGLDAMDGIIRQQQDDEGKKRNDRKTMEGILERQKTC